MIDFTKQNNLKKSKLLKNKNYVTNSILKPLARRDTWSSTHNGCFRSSVNETDEHINLKFQRWLYWRRQNADVFTELIFNTGKRADLVIVQDNGEIHIEEIAVSESEESLSEKDKIYPFPIKVIRGGKQDGRKDTNTNP